MVAEVLLFFREGKLFVGKKLEQIKKIRVLDERGRETHITPSQVFLEGKVSQNFEEFCKEVNELAREVDLEIVWEIVASTPDVHSLKLEEFVEILWGRIPRDRDERTRLLFAVAKALYSEKNFYFKREGEVWTARDEKEVQNLKNAHRVKLERERKAEIWRSFISQFKDFSGKYEGDIPEEVRRILLEIKEWFVKKEKAPSAEWVRKILGQTVSVKDDVVWRMLVFFGVMKENENFFPDRFGIKRSPPSLPPSFSFVQHARRKVTAEAFSVDVEGTQVRDDALSILNWDGKNFHILVHLADVSVLDGKNFGYFAEEVASRGKTVYFPEGKIDMLPPEIVSELSLDKGKPRPALTVEIKGEVDDKVEIRDIKIYQSEVEVAENWEFESCPVKELAELGRKLSDARVRGGGVWFLTEELGLFVEDGEDGNAKIHFARWQVNDFRTAVAEVMMLCAWAVGMWAEQNKVPLFFRFSRPVRDWSWQGGMPEGDERYIYSWQVIKTFRHVETRTEPCPNAVIGYSPYPWLTAPIRRAWDWFNVIQITRAARGEKTLEKEYLDRIKDKINVSLSTSASCEDSRYRWWLIRFIERTGNESEAVLVDIEGRKGVWWVDKVCMFLRGDAPEEPEIKFPLRMPVILRTNLLKLQIQVSLKR